MGQVTVVITSFDRIDLLENTVRTFKRWNTYPIDEYIIIDDSGRESAHRQIKELFGDYRLILNEKNIGLVESIDKAYAEVKTPYVFHTEDDYEFLESGFIERSLSVLENDPTMMQVWIRGLDDTLGQPILSTVFKTPDDVAYHIVGSHQEWFGYCFGCGLRKMEVWHRIKPYAQWSPATDFLSLRECKIGIELWRLGYRAAILPDRYARHTGTLRSTCGNIMPDKG